MRHRAARQRDTESAEFSSNSGPKERRKPPPTSGGAALPAVSPAPRTRDLADSLRRARDVTLALVRDLDDADLRRQADPKFSPIGWHVGHIAWQEELWILRRGLGTVPLDAALDEVFDSFVSEKGSRARSLPPRNALFDYLSEVRRRSAEALETVALDGHPPDSLLAGGAVFRFIANHERQHAETVGVVRILGDLPFAGEPKPRGRAESPPEPAWVDLAGGTLRVGAEEDPDAWDNEGRAHDVAVAPFQLARDPVTVAEYLGFLEAGGYRERDCWSDAGWAARQQGDWSVPRHWVNVGGTWHQRSLHGLRPLRPSAPVSFVSWYEAEAYATFAGARLPSELEWEFAARAGRSGPYRRWPSDPPGCGWLAPGDFDVACVGDGGVSLCGVRGLLGGVWEWTSSRFAPYPGFAPQHYRGYSVPWFDGRHRVARGGCFLTQPEIARSSFRNFFEPNIREIPLGIRLARS